MLHTCRQRWRKLYAVRKRISDKPRRCIMNSELYAVIMAGGRGTRFWPVSTAAMPKQFLRLTGDRTMLQETARRFQGLCDPDRVLVVTGADHAETVRAQLPWIRRENLLLEPEGRNTAACIGWAAETLVSRGAGSSLMAVVPSDHVIDS
ncbi:MAG: NTP transferase domain-containing protein, partial [Candidatus Aegiribacteria sp.]|nr:NTP transferase domain-containing protein [Candidatus Aegiribacteria sp.]MBD3294486.1 NTP transferase domain-containing protein [Candidatus Fermentibacteria bacterium]